MSPKRIAYLFGAGATHAEILNLEDSSKETFEEFLRKYGLLISHVSKRVITSAQRSSRFKKNVEEVTHRIGPVNIELLISLFASNPIIKDVDYKVNYLKDLVKKDIIKVLTPEWKRRFYLHKAFFELHELTKEKELLTGVISLNYDDILDSSYRTIYRCRQPNYWDGSDDQRRPPLLKLHGSFNWDRIKIIGKVKSVPIIPLGINKNYLIPPYNFIWSKAIEVLAKCDTLRIVGCSLNQNDMGLIDLLFKAHLESNRNFTIEIINSPQAGEMIKNSYGFFPRIKTFQEIEDGFLTNISAQNPELINPFKLWLRFKAEKMLRTNINQTIHLRKCM